MQRASGVLMHISSLNGDYSIGSFGKEALEFIDRISDAGFGWWQVLPFCPVDECNSPYKSQATFGLNPYFIDLEELYKKGLLSKEELEESKQKNMYCCEFDRLYSERLSVLKAAANRVCDKTQIKEFIDSHKYIRQFCEYMALKEQNDQKPWNEWKIDKADEDIMFVWEFIEYEFFMQWQKIKAYANSKGVKIIGDVPIYVSYESADVWANKELFLLDDDFSPKCVAGVPPDYFCKDGQLWGNPLYDWQRMKEDGYSWWLDRMRHMFMMFDGVRIDHFRGIESYWSVPYGALSAREGKWEKGPGESFIEAIKEISEDRLIIAEDLGDITKEVEMLVEKSGFPGMRVFQFGFLGEENSPHMPHNYNNKTVVYTGTHDNNTLLGYVWEQNEHERAAMLEYCGYFEKDWDKCYDSIFRTIYASGALLTIFPIQDLLGYGADTRLNTPGVAKGNWSYRVTKKQLDEINWKKFKRFNNLYARTTKGE